jgi:hypothetical protein
MVALRFARLFFMPKYKGKSADGRFSALRGVIL